MVFSQAGSGRRTKGAYGFHSPTPMSDVRPSTAAEGLDDPFPSPDDVWMFLSNTSLSSNRETDGATILCAC